MHLVGIDQLGGAISDGTCTTQELGSAKCLRLRILGIFIEAVEQELRGAGAVLHRQLQQCFDVFVGARHASR